MQHYGIALMHTSDKVDTCEELSKTLSNLTLVF